MRGAQSALPGRPRRLIAVSLASPPGQQVAMALPSSQAPPFSGQRARWAELAQSQCQGSWPDPRPREAQPRATLGPLTGFLWTPLRLPSARKCPAGRGGLPGSCTASRLSPAAAVGSLLAGGPRSRARSHHRTRPSSPDTRSRAGCTVFSGESRLWGSSRRAPAYLCPDRRTWAHGPRARDAVRCRGPFLHWCRGNKGGHFLSETTISVLWGPGWCGSVAGCAPCTEKCLV